MSASRRHTMRRERSRKTYAIEREDQLRVLSSPVRQDIVDTVAEMGPVSVVELARQLGRRPESLYYHVRELLSVELLLEAGERELPRHRERLYRTPGRQMSIRYRRSFLELHKQSLRATMRLGLRDVDRLTAADTEAIGPPIGGRATGWVSEKDRAAIDAHLDAIVRILTAGSPGPGQTLHAVTWIQARLRGRPDDADERTRT